MKGWKSKGAGSSKIKRFGPHKMASKGPVKRLNGRMHARATR